MLVPVLVLVLSPPAATRAPRGADVPGGRIGE
jgi:hypothetical protein